MKEENNETANTSQPTERQMNDMHKKAWLDFQTDAQTDKQQLSRAYAITVNKYGSYKNVPYGVKELLRKSYENHENKWGEKGTEMQKRFGTQEAEPTTNTTEDQTQKRQEFLQNIKEQRQHQQSPTLEHEPN